MKRVSACIQAEVALHSAGPLLSKVSLIAEEATLMERVALMLHPSYALKGTPAIGLACMLLLCCAMLPPFCSNVSTVNRGGHQCLDVHDRPHAAPLLRLQK